MQKFRKIVSETSGNESDEILISIIKAVEVNDFDQARKTTTKIINWYLCDRVFMYIAKAAVEAKNFEQSLKAASEISSFILRDKMLKIIKRKTK